jgi:nickel-type superoxide dismutase maturation protease
MEPALRAGDWIVVSSLSRAPRMGEIVLMRDPRDPERLIIKRVAAVSERDCTVVGDNPEESTDSRTFGPVPLANVLGRALFRYGPVGRIGWIW